MTYEAWLAKRRHWDSLVDKLVCETEEALDRSPHTAQSDIEQQYQHLPFSPRVWSAYVANVRGLRGVLRSDGRVYATHPTRMGLSCYDIANNEVAEDAAVLAIIHDYLEESGGVSRASLEAFRKVLASEPLGVDAAVVLSEPLISYEALEGTVGLSRLQRVAYVIQAEDYVSLKKHTSFANASLADKLDNLHDLSYLMKGKSQEQVQNKIAQRTAFFQLVLDRLGPLASGPFRNMLKTALDVQIEKHTTLVKHQKELRLLDEIYAANADRMRQQIKLYHETIGL